jgi:FdhD protein
MPHPVEPVRMKAASGHVFARHTPGGECREIARELAIELPTAIEINGVGYAVLMASPADLEDLAYGFLLTERLICDANEIVDVETHETDDGAIVRVTAVPHVADRLLQRVRHRTSDASCGLCGIENLEQAIRPLPRLPNRQDHAASDSAIFSALAALQAHQPLNQMTGAVHAAARCSATGGIIEVREDVGRHNAFDKLIGAMIRTGADWAGGFALLTSRCSYELVEKAALSGCPMLATISAPTELAVRRAAEAGLALRVLARPDALLASGP